MAGASPAKPMAGLRKQWIFPPTLAKRCRCALSTSPTRRSTAKVFLLDDIRVDAIGYTSDLETDDGGWVAEGFVRVENVLPQTFRLALIIQGGGETTVQMIEVNADQTADIPLNLQSGETATLVITGTTRFTREHANYSIEIR